MAPISRKIGLAFLLIASATFLISYWSSQESFLFNISAYTIAFGAFLYCFKIRNLVPFLVWKRLSFILFLIPLFAAPSLSPDVYRFLWDGELVQYGIHPYAFVPNELMSNEPRVFNVEYFKTLYENTTELSQNNYSIYPSINQLYFLVTALLSDSVGFSFVVLRIMMLLTLLMGTHYLLKILKLLNIPLTNSLFLLLNPILVIEVIGNFHFEGIVLAWLFVGIYFMLKNEWLKSSLFWAIAINIKLTPLILLPFLLRFKPFQFNLKFYLSTAFFSTGLLAIYLWPSVFWNFMQSLELYFDNFEFNAGIFYLSKWITSFFVESNPTLIVGPVLSIIAFLAILFVALFKPIKSSENWLSRMMWAYLIYLLLATTVHPWYVVLPLGLAVFSANIGVLFWSFLIMLSYGFYAFGNATFGYTLIAVEYLMLFYFLLFPKSYSLRKIKDILRLN